MNMEIILIFLEMTVLRRRGRLATKVYITFFVGNGVLKFFLFNNFFEKYSTFKNNCAKLCLRA